TKYLRSHYRARSAVDVGHSGGAAIASLLLGRYPDVAAGAVLAACPCDLPSWRKHMMTKQQNSIWEQPHQGLSPLDFASRVRPSTIVELVVGSEDQVALPEYSEEYARALRRQGVKVHYSVLSGLDHRILLQPAVLEKTLDLIARIQKLHGVQPDSADAEH